MTLKKALEVAYEALHRRSSDTNDAEEQAEILQASVILVALRLLLDGADE